eukprot:1707671-Pleurochrysis_carterae.AAC.1
MISIRCCWVESCEARSRRRRGSGARGGKARRRPSNEGEKLEEQRKAGGSLESDAASKSMVRSAQWHPPLSCSNALKPS